MTLKNSSPHCQELDKLFKEKVMKPGNHICITYRNQKANLNGHEENSKESTQTCEEVKLVNLPN
jgi:hypothetical protein